MFTGFTGETKRLTGAAILTEWQLHFALKIAEYTICTSRDFLSLYSWIWRRMLDYKRPHSNVRAVQRLLEVCVVLCKCHTVCWLRNHEFEETSPRFAHSRFEQPSPAEYCACVRGTCAPLVRTHLTILHHVRHLNKRLRNGHRITNDEPGARGQVVHCHRPTLPGRVHQREGAVGKETKSRKRTGQSHDAEDDVIRATFSCNFAQQACTCEGYKWPPTVNGWVRVSRLAQCGTGRRQANVGNRCSSFDNNTDIVREPING